MKLYLLFICMNIMYVNTVFSIKTLNGTQYDAEITYTQLGSLPKVIRIPKFSSADFPGSEVRILTIVIKEPEHTVPASMSGAIARRIFRGTNYGHGPVEGDNIAIFPDYSSHRYEVDFFKQ